MIASQPSKSPFSRTSMPEIEPSGSFEDWTRGHPDVVRERKLISFLTGTPHFATCVVVPFYSWINFPKLFNDYPFLTKQFKHGSLCGLLHAQLKLFCSCFKNHDDTDFWGKLSGDVEVWILHVRSQKTRGREMPKHLWLGRALRKATKRKNFKGFVTRI